jgi:hypothetical protein
MPDLGSNYASLLMRLVALNHHSYRYNNYRHSRAEEEVV